jgi:hypothetical protein
MDAQGFGLEDILGLVPLRIDRTGSRRGEQGNRRFHTRQDPATPPNPALATVDKNDTPSNSNSNSNSKAPG